MATLLTDTPLTKSFFEGVFTAVQNIERKNVQNFRKATINYRITDIGTNVRFKVEGSVDGTTYTDLFDSTETGNGSFTSGELDITGVAFIRGRIESISGGSPTIVVHTTLERFINPNVQIGGDDFSSDIEEALNNASAPTSANPFATVADVPPPPLGDMTKAVYDPTSVDGDAFDIDNMVEGTAKILTTAERTTISNQSGTNTGDEPTANETTEGVLEVATQAETDAEALDTKTITPSKLGGWLTDLLTRALTWTGIPTFFNGVIFTEKASIPDTEGLVSYVDKSLVLKTDIAGSTQSLGQEFWIRVINKTGVSIPDGSLVYKNGFDAASGRSTIALAKADIQATSDVLGFTTNTMANNAEGFVTVIGLLNDLDTSSFSVNDELFLSDTVAGAVTTTKPLNAIPIGTVNIVNATTGQILTTIARKIVDSPLFAQLSDSTNQKPTTTSPTVITFDANDDIRGITHGIVSATEDIIISVPGTYTIYAQPQVERTSGASAEMFHMWMRVGTDDNGGVSSVSVANPSVITTDAPHGLSNGQTVEISDVVTTPDINGQHIITVTGASTYTIPVNVTVVTDGVGNWRRVLDINDDLANTNVELRVAGSNFSDVIPLIVTMDMLVGEKINIMQSVSATSNGIGLVTSTPAGEPAIPSIILAINKN